jgi:hypothetical protein
MNSLSFKTVAFMAVLCIVLGIFVARGLNPPTAEMTEVNSGLRQQVHQLTAQLQQQIQSPPAVQPAVVGFEYGWRIALLILFFGGAIAAVSYLFIQARLIRPNRFGQFPVVVERTLGQTAYSDLNLQVAPTSVIERPGLRAQLSAQLKGQSEKPLAVSAHHAVDPQAQVEVKRGTQLVQVMIAASATPASANAPFAADLKGQGRGLAAPALAALFASPIRPELPPVNVIELRPGQEYQVAQIFHKHASAL